MLETTPKQSPIQTCSEKEIKISNSIKKQRSTSLNATKKQKYETKQTHKNEIQKGANLQGYREINVSSNLPRSFY